MTVCYLEIDDEITGAIARIRAVTDGEAVIVVPSGARIATSRINFKLLVREATERHINVAAVSDEPSVRALAVSAGLAAYDSLAAAEQSLATLRGQPHDAQPDTRPKPITGDRAPAAAAKPARAVVPAAVPAITEPVELQSRTQRRIGFVPLVGAGVLLLLLAGIGYGAYVLLPTATITLEPLTTELRPAPFTVVADPNVAVADVAAGAIPAQWIEVPVSVSTSFTTTGVEVREEHATGIARFRSENTLNAVAIPLNTVISTDDGINFETTEPATVRPADFGTGTPGIVEVRIRAQRPGPRGNVAKDAITRVPPRLREQLISVGNDPTEGGRRVEESLVAQDDYDAALASLMGQLPGALSDELADPATTPRGLTLFATTAIIGEPAADQTAAELVGTARASFELTVETTATVLAVNEALVDEVAEARLRSLLEAGQSILGDEVQATRSAGRVLGQTIAYDVAAVAVAYTEPDRAVIVAQLRGKSIADAQRILSVYGMVEISMWPDFVDRLPDQTARINLIVIPPSPRA